MAIIKILPKERKSIHIDGILIGEVVNNSEEPLLYDEELQDFVDET